jgi:Zn-dependent protease with chaperone function
MGYMAHIVLALFAQALVESGVSTGDESVLGVILLGLAPLVCAALAHQAFLTGRFKLGEKFYALLSWSAPLAYVIALTVCGWSASVAGWTGHQTSFLVWPDWTAALLIAPFLVYEVVAIHARSLVASPRSERATWRRFQWRMLAFGIAPLAVYFLVSSLIGLSEPLRVRIETVGVWSALFVLMILGTIGWMLPRLLTWTWDMEPVPEGPQRDLLLSVAELARFEHPRIYVWKTGHSTANALIVGLTKKSRVVLFSDSLLAQMSPSELAAVFAHEMGHAFRRHVPIFTVFMLGFVMLGDLIAQHYFSDAPVWAGLTLLGIMGPALLAFGFLSRRFELDADLFSLDVLGEVRSLMSALEKVGGHFRDIAGWRHFSTADRVAFLERAQADPNVGRRLRRDLKRYTYAGVLLFVVTGVLQVHRLLENYPADEVRADLRLGRYESARERAERAPEIDPLLRAAVERAYETRADSSPSALARRALEALRKGAPEEAREWLQLGALRGDDEMDAMDAYIGEHGAVNLPNALVQRLVELAARSDPQ